ncbi:hypothetical protein FIBSPDRAFT_934767 [Athelia psychrophila]|uniref:Uncharacterized protein n=1 Tax=Athelia psychrophila TaxID=1759441 RepID=A0A166EWG5_9AGAM|nr:hypothetical protein FIBSPDRAFT_934767 [Fibularhizoctonia sp. CBS 109695]
MRAAQPLSHDPTGWPYYTELSDVGPLFLSHPLASSFYALRFCLFPPPAPSARNKYLRPLEWMQPPRRAALLPCVLCTHGGMAAGRWERDAGLWAEVEIVWKALEGSRAEEKGHRLRAIHILGPDATSTHRKLAEGHSVDHSAIELLTGGVLGVGDSTGPIRGFVLDV